MKLLYEETLFGDCGDYIALYEGFTKGSILVTDLKYNMIKKSITGCDFYKQYKDVFEQRVMDSIMEVIDGE